MIRYITLGLADSHADAVVFDVIAMKLSCLLPLVGRSRSLSGRDSGTLAWTGPCGWDRQYLHDGFCDQI
ncbi:MAG: hypothetical protein ACREEV_13105, partial [Dongiaceae bacterium]